MRRQDSGWRDESLHFRHAEWGFAAPAAGMVLPFVEYDRGIPVALISYLSRHEALPTGTDTMAAIHALGGLYNASGDMLPFFTVQYDPRNWAVRLYPHNRVAIELLGRTGWSPMNETRFSGLLYRLRGRSAPILAPYGVDFGTEAWIVSEPSPDHKPSEAWPGQLMSARRRAYEPVSQTRMSWRNPCTDIDFAVVDQDNRVALVVDYKTPGATVNLSSTNAKALSSLHVRNGGTAYRVPAMVVCYEPGPSWSFRVHCLNESARQHLSYVLGAIDGAESALTAVVTGAEWVTLTEQQWTEVLRVARDL